MILDEIVVLKRAFYRKSGQAATTIRMSSRQFEELVQEVKKSFYVRRPYGPPASVYGMAIKIDERVEYPICSSGEET